MVSVSCPSAKLNRGSLGVFETEQGFYLQIGSELDWALGPHCEPVVALSVQAKLLSQPLLASQEIVVPRGLLIFHLPNAIGAYRWPQPERIISK